MSASNATPRGARAQHIKVQLALHWLGRSYAEPGLRLSNIAKELGLSASHLGFLVRRDTGSTYRCELVRLRVREAKRLLVCQVSVKETAFRVGYRHVSSFSREFRRMTGRAPTDWLHEVRAVLQRLEARRRRQLAAVEVAPKPGGRKSGKST